MRPTPLIPDIREILESTQIFNPRTKEPRPELLRCHPRAYMGLDLGQAQDNAALVILQRLELVFPSKRDPVTYQHRHATVILARYAERIPLGLAYPAVARHVADLAAIPPMQDRGQIVVDATGVGAPVVDILRATVGLRSRIVPVVITSGDHESERDTRFYVPKLDLMAGLRVAFEGHSIALTSEVEGALDLKAELTDLRQTRSHTGSERVTGRYKDDLAIALALAWWRASREAGRLS